MGIEDWAQSQIPTILIKFIKYFKLIIINIKQKNFY